MTRQIGPQGYALSSNYIVSSTARDGYYTTIGGAITQAVADGASTSNPKLIEIKEGSFTENVSLPDGITLWTADVAIIVGTITFTTGTAYITGMEINPPSGQTAFAIQGGTLTVSNAIINITNAVGITYTTATNKSFTLNNSTMTGDVTSSFYTHDGSAATINHLIQSSTVRFNTAQSTLSGAAGIVNSNYDNSSIWHSMDVSIPTFNHSSMSSVNNQGTAGPFFDIQAGVTGGQVSCLYTRFANNGGSSDPFINFGVNISYEEYRCIFDAAGGGFNGINLVADQTVLNRDLDVLGVKLFSSSRTGYEGSDYNVSQGRVQTSSTSPTAIYTLPVAAGTAISGRAIVSAANATHTDMTGCTIDFMADGTAAALIGVPVVNQFSSTSGLVDVVFSAGNVLIRGTAPSAAAYNWVAYVEWQPILTNS